MFLSKLNSLNPENINKKEKVTKAVAGKLPVKSNRIGPRYTFNFLSCYSHKLLFLL